MSAVTCLHPLCNNHMSRGRLCCSRHWARLPDDIRNELMAADASYLEEIKAQAVEYFDSRRIGDNEIVECRYCGKDVVWIDGKYGSMLIDVDGVEDEDTAYDPKRHTYHRRTCDGSRNS